VQCCYLFHRFATGRALSTPSHSVVLVPSSDSSALVLATSFAIRIFYIQPSRRRLILFLSLLVSSVVPWQYHVLKRPGMPFQVLRSCMVLATLRMRGHSPRVRVYSMALLLTVTMCMYNVRAAIELASRHPVTYIQPIQFRDAIFANTVKRSTGGVVCNMAWRGLVQCSTVFKG
jgi:hypothetical protein